MAYYLAIIFLLISLGGILYVVKKKISLLTNLPEQEVAGRAGQQSIFANAINKLKEVHYTKYKVSVFGWLECVFRKLRVWLLKTDSFFVNRLQNMKERSRIFNIRAKAWLVKKHIEDVQQQGEIDELMNGEKKEFEVVEMEKALGVDEEKELLAKIVKNPRSPDLYKKLADLYIGKNNFQDAKSSLLEVIKLRPTDTEALEKLEELEKQ